MMDNILLGNMLRKDTLGLLRRIAYLSTVFKIKFRIVKIFFTLCFYHSISVTGSFIQAIKALIARNYNTI